MSYQLRYTKTFIERTWWRRVDDENELVWQRIPYTKTKEVPLDEQITAFVEETGAIIIHPGQLGIHTQWHDEEMKLKQVSIGTTILYIDGRRHAQRVRHGQETAADPGGADGTAGLADPTGEGDAGANVAYPAATLGGGPTNGNTIVGRASTIPIVAAVERPPVGATSCAGAAGAAAGATAAESTGGGCGGDSSDFGPEHAPVKRRRAARPDPLAGTL